MLPAAAEDGGGPAHQVDDKVLKTKAVIGINLLPFIVCTISQIPIFHIQALFFRSTTKLNQKMQYVSVHVRQQITTKKLELLEGIFYTKTKHNLVYNMIENTKMN